MGGGGRVYNNIFLYKIERPLCGLGRNGGEGLLRRGVGNIGCGRGEVEEGGMGGARWVGSGWRGGG